MLKSWRPLHEGARYHKTTELDTLWQWHTGLEGLCLDLKCDRSFDCNWRQQSYLKDSVSQCADVQWHIGWAHFVLEFSVNGSYPRCWIYWTHNRAERRQVKNRICWHEVRRWLSADWHWQSSSFRFLKRGKIVFVRRRRKKKHTYQIWSYLKPRQGLFRKRNGLNSWDKETNTRNWWRICWTGFQYPNLSGS